MNLNLSTKNVNFEQKTKTSKLDINGTKFKHQINNFRGSDNTLGSPSENFSGFEKRLINHPDLVSIEMALPQPNLQNKEIIPFKKKYQMNSYVEKYNKHRESLTIPELPRVRKPVDISKNIIENKPKVEALSIKIQSDEFIESTVNHTNNINTNNTELNKYRANMDPSFNLYLEKNNKVYVADTQDYDFTHNLQTNNFVKQKTGKDVSTQIEDGDLFCFDIDVEPLLTVVTNKILEQALLEITEEQEIKNLRETKLKYWKKNHDEKARVKKIELEEINRKKEIENMKKIKMIDKTNKIYSQQKLLARVSAKTYLSKLRDNTFNVLKQNNMFNNFKEIVLKESTIKILNVTTKKCSGNDEELLNTVTSLVKDSVDNEFLDHRDVLDNRRQVLEQKRLEELEKQKRLEEELEKARLEREKRRYQKRVNKLKNDIKINVIKSAQIKGEYFAEDIMSVAGPADFSTDEDEKMSYGKFYLLYNLFSWCIWRNYYSIRYWSYNFEIRNI